MQEINLDNKFYLYESSSDKYVVFVHGMVETMNGYLKVKDFLVDSGYNVVLYNQRGHGEDTEKLGYLYKGDDFKLVNDVIEIEKHLKRCFNASEVIIVAHSFGTAVVRAALNITSFDKVVLNGMFNYLNKFSGSLSFALFSVLPRDKPTHLFNKLIFRQYKKKVVYGKSWICTNEDYLAFYKNNPYSGFVGYASYYKTIFKLGMKAKPTNVKPTKMFFTSGLGDPVSNFGKSCLINQKLYQKLGCNVEVKLYEKMNHFIYDEIDCQVCYDDLVRFIEE